MTTAEPSFSVEVDVTNPGQFFACCGLLELAHRLWPDTQGCFTDNTFETHISEPVINPVDVIADKLHETEIETDPYRGDTALHPVLLESFDLAIDWWIDARGRTTPIKLWAGRQTSKQIVEELRRATTEVLKSSEIAGVFQAERALTTRFGVDFRSAWNTLDVGFSPNEQDMKVCTFPAVELLAAIGLQGFRPGREGSEYFYATWHMPLPTIAARAACSALIAEGHLRRYRFHITRRGSYKAFNYATHITGGWI